MSTTTPINKIFLVDIFLLSNFLNSLTSFTPNFLYRFNPPIRIINSNKLPINGFTIEKSLDAIIPDLASTNNAIDTAYITASE